MLEAGSQLLSSPYHLIAHIVEDALAIAVGLLERPLEPAQEGSILDCDVTGHQTISSWQSSWRSTWRASSGITSWISSTLVP